jgi:hypothetical protein
MLSQNDRRHGWPASMPALMVTQSVSVMTRA